MLWFKVGIIIAVIVEVMLFCITMTLEEEDKEFIAIMNLTVGFLTVFIWPMAIIIVAFNIDYVFGAMKRSVVYWLKKLKDVIKNVNVL